jgi:hypothetical protein
MRVMRKTLKVQKSKKVINGHPCYDLLEAGVVVGTFITEEKALTAMGKRRFYNSGEQSALKHGFTPEVLMMHKIMGGFSEVDGI